MDTLPPTQSLWVILLILFGLSMFFTLIEQSTIVVNDAKLKKLADSGNKKAIRLSKFLDGNSGDFVASIQFINSLLLLSIGGCAIYMYLIPLVSYFTELNINIIDACILSFVIISFITTLVYLIFGIFVPKGLAGKYSESISVYHLYGFLELYQKLF